MSNPDRLQPAWLPPEVQFALDYIRRQDENRIARLNVPPVSISDHENVPPSETETLALSESIPIEIPVSSSTLVHETVVENIPQHYNYQDMQILYESCIPNNAQYFELNLKSLQAESIFHILSAKDLLCILPTNYGKTLIMVMSSLILAKLRNHIIYCLIISPLKTLMSDLKGRLNKYGLGSATITASSLMNGTLQKELETPKPGQPFYILSSPEMLQHLKTREMLTCFPISQIIVDECHLTSEWGKTFRKDYASIHEVRQYLQCPLALFTATLNEKTKTEVINSTGMRKDMVTVGENPDRPEIFLEMRKRGSFEDSFTFLANEANTFGKNMRKTLIFIKSLDNTTLYNLSFRRMLTDKGRIHNQTKKRPDYLSEHFSAQTGIQASTRIRKDFELENGQIRVLFSTIAYGLGINNQYIERVIIYDTDTVKSSLWQKISRGCRGGKKGEAIIFVGSDRLTTESFFKKGVCMRHTILSGLTGYPTASSLLNTTPCVGCNSSTTCSRQVCCTICKSMCICEQTMEVDP